MDGLGIFERLKVPDFEGVRCEFVEGFGYYKRELLHGAFAYIKGLYEAWWRGEHLVSPKSGFRAIGDGRASDA